MAVLLLMSGVTLFAIQDTIFKLLGEHGFPPVQVIWVRYTTHLLLAMLIPYLRCRRLPWRSARPKLQLLRSVLLASASSCAVTALPHLPLADAATIAMTMPLFITLLAIPVLRERVGWRRLAALGVGFIGVLLVLRPGRSGFDPFALVMLGSAVLASVYMVVTRITSRIDPHEVSFFFTALFGALASLPFMPFMFRPPTDATDLCLLVAIGFCGAIGHLLIIMAHRHAPAGVLAPFTYTQLMVAVFLGWLVYQRLPDAYTWAGAAILIASGLYVWHRERLLSQATTLPAAA